MTRPPKTKSATPMMKQYLEKTGLYAVDVERTEYTWQGKEHIARYLAHIGANTKALPSPRPIRISNPIFRNTMW